ncbi:hypothetical protein RQP54_02295 [Curvibacter sp. APW13]|uniref:ParB N-terminal domain-containing protein n=1 Tax=Curvibacter sp. APW13 TaxID=3077236 RepID=UPI0028DE06E6|nr:ParB N-terminal domain-containing protein [Curvibacter sp. APW13]MDT8989688.1 hypothetical protein [Curvibacter sp. APW13]
MSRPNKQMTRSDAWFKLNLQLRKGKPQPATKPTTLALGQVKQWPEVFQQRRPAKHLSEAHVRSLASKAKVSPLDPLTVWWDGKTWACIDGHHRMDAYRAVGTRDIPVVVFEGSLEEALVLSAKANTRDKLPMGRGEKSNAAWHLVVKTSLSKAAQAEASGISERLVAHMRSAKATLEAKGVANLEDMSWEEARRMAAGEGAQPDWDEGETEKRAQEMATRLHKALGMGASSKVDVFARAVEIYSPLLYEGLVAYLQDEPEEEYEE